MIPTPKQVAVVAVLALAAVSCTNDTSPLPEALAAQSGSGYEYCGISGPGIAYDTDLSTYEPTNQGEYCQGFRFGYDYARNTDPSVCDEFWTTPDSDILELFMSPAGGSNSFSSGVGIIDALWTTC